MTLKIALCSCELEECQFCNTGHVNEANELSKLVTRFLHDTKSLCNTILGICNEKEGTSRRGRTKYTILGICNEKEGISGRGRTKYTILGICNEKEGISRRGRTKYTILGICNEKEGTSRRGCSNQRKAGWYYLEAEEGITCIVLVEEG